MRKLHLITAIHVLHFFVADIHSSIILEPRRCLNFYDDRGFLFRESLSSYEEAITYCTSKRGKPLMPTEKSWYDFLEYVREQTNLTEQVYEGCWVGVEITKIENSTFHVVDSDNLQLNGQQIRQIFDFSLDELELQIGEKRCVAYFPRTVDSNEPSFQLQLCTTGPLARVACRCISDVEKYETMTTAGDITTTFASSEVPRTIGNFTGPSVTAIKPRIGEGQEDVISSEQANTVTDSSSPFVVAILGLLVACCLIASTYFLVKKRGWNWQSGMSRRMPHNRARTSNNASAYRQGQEMSEISHSENRPIHVYEEIIPRSSRGAGNVQRIALTSASSSITLPQIPPPDPPSTSRHEDFSSGRGERSSRSSDDGYLQPSFVRSDAIPGDVRSPPPVDANIFFPADKEKKSDLLRPPCETELKYASVETVQTLLDGEQPTDEEYLVDDEEAYKSEHENQFGSLLVQIPDETANSSMLETDRNSIPDSYVQIKGELGLRNPQTHPESSDSSPVFVQRNEYENECFPKTVAKAPPVKPKRRWLTTKTSPSETQKNPANDAVIYSRIPSVSTDALYSKVKPKDERDQPHKVDRLSAAYTPMRSDTFRRDHSTDTTANASDSEFSDDETSVDQSGEVTENAAHEYHNIPYGSNTFISRPQMVSTTNRELATMVCYDIPPPEIGESNA